MKSRIQQIGLVVVTVLAAIAFVQVIHHHMPTTEEETACEATEVYRWSDQSCYTPQGE